MRSLSLKAKLLILAGAVLFFSILGGIVGMNTTSKVADAYSRVNSQTIPMLKRLLDLNENIIEARLSMVTMSQRKDSTLAKLDTDIAATTTHLKDARAALESLKKTNSDDEKNALMNVDIPLAKLERDFLAAADLAKKAQGKEGPELTALHKMIEEDIDLDGDKLEAGVKVIAAYIDTDAKKATDEAEVVKSTGVKLVSLINVVSLILGLLLALYITNDLLKTFRGIVQALTESSMQVGAASTNVANTAVILSQATTEQAAALGETASSVEEMSAMVTKNSDGSKQAVELSKQSESSAHHGQAVVREMISAIEEINISNNNIMNQVNESNKRFQEIVNVIQEIGNKTKVINDIVFQTKLLSFNASVEAARAGEHGKGFAVVAEEIGNLAQMSGTASKDISTMLDESIKNVDTIVQETKVGVEKLINEGRNKVALGTKVANECGVVLNDIVNNVTQVTTMSDEISVASGEQSRGVAEVSKAMGQLDEMTQQNAGTSTKTAQAAEELSKESEKMKSLIQDLVKSIEGGATKVTHAKISQAKASPAKASPEKVVTPKVSTPKPAKESKPFFNFKLSNLLPKSKKKEAKKVVAEAPKPAKKPIATPVDLGIKTSSSSSPSNTPSHDDERFTDV